MEQTLLVKDGVISVSENTTDGTCTILVVDSQKVKLLVVSNLSKKFCPTCCTSMSSVGISGTGSIYNCSHCKKNIVIGDAMEF